jgi:hypothetical protein
MAGSAQTSASAIDIGVFDRYIKVDEIAIWTNLDNLAMFMEDLRLATFADWSTNRALPSELAVRGFYYRGSPGVVHCAICGRSFDGWKRLEDLTARHNLENPSCVGVYGKSSGNIPLYNPNQSGWKIKSTSNEEGSINRRILVRLPPNTLTIKARPSIFRNEMNRLESFNRNGWSLFSPSGAEMAKNGFYFSPKKLARCAFCTVKIRKWNLESVPPQRHLQKSPSCPFIRNKNLCENEPIVHSADPSFDFVELTEGVNMVTKVDDKNFRSIQEVKEIIIGDKGNSGEFRNFTAIPHNTPMNLHMSIATVRLDTYKNAGKLNLAPSELAEVGFYFVGPDDFVRCFACNGGLYGWKRGEDAWERHAGFYPECLYVNHVKDKKFVADQVAKFSSGLNHGNSDRERKVRGKLFSCRNCLQPADLLFTRCGHLSACMKCQDNLSVCPQCQKKSENRLQVFF